MGEASACAKARGLLLPPSAQPATGPSRLVAPVSELSVRVEWRKPLAAAPRRLHLRVAGEYHPSPGLPGHAVTVPTPSAGHTARTSEPRRKGSQLLPGPGGCCQWTRLNSGVAPDRRPGRGVAGGKSRRPAGPGRPFSLRPTRKLGQSGCRMRPVPFFLGPGGRPGWGTPCQVARPAQQPSRPVVPGEAIRVKGARIIMTLSSRTVVVI